MISWINEVFRLHSEQQSFGSWVKAVNWHLVSLGCHAENSERYRIIFKVQATQYMIAQSTDELDS